MQKLIVTTTVNRPSEALLKYAAMSDWQLLVVGDLKTPHDDYVSLNCMYMHPLEQEKKYPELSACIGWNKVERRNIGIVEAYNLGAEVVATVDDDNIPEAGWGEHLLVGEEVECPVYENEQGVFCPLSVTSKPHLWHRGYPLQLLHTRMNNILLGKRKLRPLVQADLWNGEPDLDAIYRLTVRYDPEERFDDFQPFSCVGYSPFNSQNTFLHRSVLPYYMMVPGLGRVHDIWAAYLVERQFPNSVVYGSASVYQRRNEHDVVTDYLAEKDTYHLSLACIQDSLPADWQARIDKALKVYQAALR